MGAALPPGCLPSQADHTLSPLQKSGLRPWEIPEGTALAVGRGDG